MSVRLFQYELICLPLYIQRRVYLLLPLLVQCQTSTTPALRPGPTIVNPWAIINFSSGTLRFFSVKNWAKQSTGAFANSLSFQTEHLDIYFISMSVHNSTYLYRREYFIVFSKFLLQSGFIKFCQYFNSGTGMVGLL
jgi:hypothetical protein